jgi:hypothetical protein
MAMDIDLETFMRHLPHDGSDILIPDLPDPLGRACFIPSELDFACISLGWAPVTIDVDPRDCMDYQRRNYPSQEKILRYAWPRRVVLTTVSERLPEPFLHCVAHDTNTRVFYDPAAGIRPLYELPRLKHITIFFDCRDHYNEQYS